MQLRRGKKNRSRQITDVRCRSMSLSEIASETNANLMNKFSRPWLFFCDNMASIRHDGKRNKLIAVHLLA